MYSALHTSEVQGAVEALQLQGHEVQLQASRWSALHEVQLHGGCVKHSHNVCHTHAVWCAGDEHVSDLQAQTEPPAMVVRHSPLQLAASGSWTLGQKGRGRCTQPPPSAACALGTWHQSQVSRPAGGMEGQAGTYG
jgi:hypothetical protein